MPARFRGTTSLRYSTHAWRSSVVGALIGALTCACTASSLLQPASTGSTRQAISIRRLIVFIRILILYPPPGSSSYIVALPFGLQRSGHRWRHERRNVAAKTGNLAYQRRRNESVFLGRSQEQRFDLGHQVAVHARQLEFVLEVRHRAQPAQQHPRAKAAHELRQQAVEPQDFDIGMGGQRL